MRYPCNLTFEVIVYTEKTPMLPTSFWKLNLMDAGGVGAVHKDGLDLEGLSFGGGQRQGQVHERVELAGGGVAVGADQRRLEQAL